MPAAIVGGIVGLAGLGMQGASMIASKNAANAAQDESIKIGGQTAGMLEAQAGQGERVMGYQLGQMDSGAKKFLGSQKAAISASGILGNGSSGLTRSNSINNLRADRANLYDSYSNKIRELRTKAGYARENGAQQASLIGLQNTANMWGMGANMLNSASNLTSNIFSALG